MLQTNQERPVVDELVMPRVAGLQRWRASRSAVDLFAWIRALRPDAGWGLVALSVALLLVRVAYIMRVPDLDGDAYAHFEIAQAVRRAPTALAPHWVWLPGYHLFLALLQTAGASFLHVRLLNALLQTAGPFLLFALARRRHTPAIALRAAVFYCVCSLPNVLGTSALGEVPFTLLVLGAVIALDAGEHDARSSMLAGACLVVACTMRYEAWVASTAVGACWLAAAARSRAFAWKRVPAFAMPAFAIAGYVLFRRWADGQWLWFVHETLRFTNMQRNVVARSLVFETFWFPIVLPWKLVGPALLLGPLGAVRLPSDGRLRLGTIVPAAIAMFLFAVYAGNSILGLARYWSSLIPFLCLLVARGTAVVERRWGARRSPIVIGAVLASLAITATRELTSSARLALAGESDLRETEKRVNGR